MEFFRAVPVLLLMILIFFSYGISRGDSGAYWTVVIALMLYNGAVLAEVFRAGILAVPRGQAEAAYAVGMRKTQVMNIILLPQAVKIMLPAIISQMVVALKDTSLGYVVAAPGLTAIGEQIYRQFQNQVPTAIVLAAIYIVVNLVLTWLATWVQKRFVGEKKPLEVSVVGDLDDGRGALTLTCGRDPQPDLALDHDLAVVADGPHPDRDVAALVGQGVVAHCAGSVSAMQVTSEVALAV